MPGCKFSLLDNSISDEKIKIVIELAPLTGQIFDMPIKDFMARFAAIANYAKGTFASETVPVSEDEPGPDPGPAPRKPSLPPGLPTKEEKEAIRRKRTDEKIKRGHEVALKEFTRALDEAKKKGDKGLIEQAQANLARVNERIKRYKEGLRAEKQEEQINQQKQGAVPGK